MGVSYRTKDEVASGVFRKRNVNSGPLWCEAPPDRVIVDLLRSQEQALAVLEEFGAGVKLLKTQGADPTNPRSCEPGAMDGAFEVNEEFERFSDCEGPMTPETKTCVAQIYQRTDFSRRSIVRPPNQGQPAIATHHLQTLMTAMLIMASGRGHVRPFPIT